MWLLDNLPTKMVLINKEQIPSDFISCGTGHSKQYVILHCKKREKGELKFYENVSIFWHWLLKG